MNTKFLIFGIILMLILIYVSSLKTHKKYEIVVAKYNEDISWLNEYKKNCVIYDKSKGDLPNIGRESHTYLTYIIDNYENLPDVVFFTQGNKSDHYEQTIDYFLNIDKYSKNYNYLSSDYYFYSENTQEYSKDHLYGYRNMQPSPSDNLGFRKWFNTYIDKEYDINSYVTLWWGAIFSVKREQILSRSKDFYKTLLNYIPKTNNPEVGHYFERSWFYIFNCHKT